MDLVNTNDLGFFIAEYDSKKESLEIIEREIEEFGIYINSKIVVSGHYGGLSFHQDHLTKETAKSNLTRSAWRNLLDKINFFTIATSQDKKFWGQVLDSHDIPEFTELNIIENLKTYYQNPRETILRGLAEVFTKLDPFYKSHTRVGIGKKGLPKRIILNNYGYSWDGFCPSTDTKEKITDILNCLSLLSSGEIYAYHNDKLKDFFKSTDEVNGCTLKLYSQTTHVYFKPPTLKLVSEALSEYFGAVLPDVDETPKSKQTSTEVSKKLQFYPTPKKVINQILSDCYISKENRVLEPSCGDGVVMEEILKHTKLVDGYEIDFNRFSLCKEKGFNVSNTNFLEAIVTKKYDWVIMNPPFYGKHWMKHLDHAKKFLKKDGTLICILPASAFYDGHLGDISDNQCRTSRWVDLPFGSFKESGTNIETGYLRYIKN